MDILLFVSSIASLIGLALSIYIIILSKRMPSAIRNYSHAIEYNRQRQNLMDQFEADLNILKDESRLLKDQNLKMKLFDDIYALQAFSGIIDKKTQKVIESSIELIRSGEEKERDSLIENIIILKNFCKEERGYFYGVSKSPRTY